ncbi:DNA methyltransferase family protein [Aliarcobacter cryaerophilus]|uniref:DNA methyltransferase n=1 Tax=Aliarcobacter cryaerophilus TaxID=28198 RepID=UPI0021B3BAA1|nr:DNA methyltransferase [Aliarcobacter cryaerophilus]MCT7507409.1 hypothetical protein [Aliarcobacter cryaerophilus]
MELMQIKSKDRVANHGEVFTNIREVNAMLDLVKDETHRIDSRFLEPACGTGNFLIEVLRRKLEVVESRYKKSKIEFERYSILALSSIYGIDILEDNLKECKTRLYELFLNFYKSIFKKDIDDRCLKSAKFILDKNIIWGDALTLLRVDGSNLPIVFSEWSAVNGSFLKRRDFTLNELLRNSTSGDLGLFSDLGDEAFIPTPIKEYPLTHFLEIYND